jgi:hypothetical protein
VREADRVDRAITAHKPRAKKKNEIDPELLMMGVAEHVTQLFAARERHGLHDPRDWVHCDEICIRVSSMSAVIWDYTGEEGDYRSSGMEKETLTGMFAATAGTGFKFPPFYIAKAAKTDLTYTLRHKPSDPAMPFMVIWRRKGYMSASAYKVFLKWLRPHAVNCRAGGTNTYNVPDEKEEPLGPDAGGSDFTFRTDPPESDEGAESEEDQVNLDEEQLRKIIAELLRDVRQPDVLLGLAHDYAYAHHTSEMEALARTLFFITIVIAKGLTGKLQVMDLAVFKPLRALYNEIQIEDLKNLHMQGLYPKSIMEWRDLAIKWMCEAWRRIPSAIIVRAAKKSGLSIHEDGSEDHLFNVQLGHEKIDITPFRELGLRLGRQQREQDQLGEGPEEEEEEREEAAQQELKNVAAQQEQRQEPRRSTRSKKRQRTNPSRLPDADSDIVRCR